MQRFPLGQPGLKSFEKSLLRELSFDPTHVFFEHLSVADLLLHVPGFFGVSSKHQKTWSQTVQAVNGTQIFQIVFLGQNEDNCIVTVATTGMNLQCSRQIFFTKIFFHQVGSRRFVFLAISSDERAQPQVDEPSFIFFQTYKLPMEQEKRRW